MIIETHVHLCDEKYDADRDEILKRANEAGVMKFLNIGAELKEVRKIAIMEIDNVFKAMGLHPHNAHEFSPAVYDEIKGYFKAQKKAVAVGEIGLDYYKSTTPKELQEKVFRAFLDLAKELDLPVAIHSREAFDDVYKLLKEYGIRKRGVIHCFTGDVNNAKRFIDMGYMLGIGGVITYPNAETLRQAVSEVPLEWLVLETDAPWLAPQAERGKRNEPACLKHIVQALARVKNVSVETIESVTTENAENLFNI